MEENITHSPESVPLREIAINGNGTTTDALSEDVPDSAIPTPAVETTTYTDGTAMTETQVCTVLTVCFVILFTLCLLWIAVTHWIPKRNT